MKFKAGDIVRLELETSEHINFGSPIGCVVDYKMESLIGYKLATKTCLVDWCGQQDVVFEDYLELYDKAL